VPGLCRDHPARKDFITREVPGRSGELDHATNKPRAFCREISTVESILHTTGIPAPIDRCNCEIKIAVVQNGSEA
jgi:hypothetical protein